ncbi:interferon-induced very large GTPase 1-like [Callorhinchus milii]|uniref:interferon-induced very large GTPase 1-like n=1 Tax=Callorhinchus milii TaxID=7868 RepID=UPI001C3FDE94|nr:interferon-induced very large GTPase 1-like [Callorhinchus milii]
MLCKQLNQEMLPRVREAIMTNNRTIITDAKLMKETLQSLSSKAIPGPQLSESLSEFGDSFPCQNTASPSDLNDIQTGPSNSSNSGPPPKMLTDLGLLDYYPRKLSLRQMRGISADKLKDIKPTGPEGIPWHFLQRVLMANSTARNPDWPLIQQLENRLDVDEDFADFFEDKKRQVTGINPLDVTVATFLCADHFLRQELMLKMSLCQFALPFLLPDGDTAIFLLWAMRSIVKQWRPQSLVGNCGFVEDNIVTSALPTFSFIRLGRCTVSKSKILNLTLSRSEQQQNFFLHSQMEYSDQPREMSDGLVEICWYLPCGKVNLDILPEACAFINLRGEGKAHQKQARFLAKVSNALFVFIDVVGEEEREFLTSLTPSPTQFFLITNSSGNEQKVTPQQMRELFKSLNLQSHQLLVRKDKNDAQFVEILRSKIKSLLTLGEVGQRGLEEMAIVARESGICIDEDEPEINRGKQLANNILIDIHSRDIAEYKQTALPFQGKLWQEWSKAEKEKCRMKHCQNKPMELYGHELNQKQNQIRKIQSEKNVSEEMKQFIAALKKTSEAEQGFFMQWLKLGLDRKSRQIISKLRVQSKTLHKNSKESSTELNELDQKIADSSLGLEHFMRELSQIYEICATLGKERISENTLSMLPGVAADLMLGGFPLELIDGDVSNIPMQWVTAVLKGVTRRVGNDCRIFVLTVLGVQSTGKSTLLNTMFGLQFAVSSGRCTRGAYMQLIKLTGGLETELGSDFILVIDTEGLKAPELASLGDSYEHDNELATLVIGLSDVTLVNMSMENSTEMKDILQIVVHSFIRMRATGKKPICQFVHQNVAGVSAHDQTLRDRQKLLKQLDEMTEAAARMEKLQRVTFCDVLDYDTDRNNWYIPGLWHGVPPMAAVNTGYSEHVFELKKSLFTCFSNCNKKQKALTIPNFIKWMSGLWDQIKHENFIFSFQNSLVAEAYSQLSRNYSAWDLEIRTFAHTWTIETENRIKNTNTEEFPHQSLTLEITTKMEEKKNEILNKLEEYYESRDHNVHLMESYREQFRISIQSLCSQLQNESTQKCEEVIRRREALDKVDKIWDEYNKQIEDEVMILLQYCKKDGKEMDDCKLEEEFKRMWQRTLEKLSYRPSKETNIEADVENLLRKNMPTQGKVISEALRGKVLSKLGLHMFDVKKKHIDQKIGINMLVGFIVETSEVKKARLLSKCLEEECKEDIDSITKKDVDYDSKYCVDILWNLDKNIENNSEPEFKMSEIYKAEFKLHMCGYAAQKFKVMHNVFVNKHNPWKRMENMENQYFELFKQIYTKQDMTEKGAERFAKNCFIPAVREAILNCLGHRIVLDMKKNDSSGEYSNRNSFTVALLVHLKQQDKFDQYLNYINHFKSFANNWLRGQVINYCNTKTNGDTKFIHLAKVHLKEITNEAKEIVREAIAQNVSGEARSFLDLFVDKLKAKLAMPKDSLKLVVFQPASKAGNFAKMVLPHIQEAETSLLQELTTWNVNAMIEQLPVKPHEEILKKLISCNKKCPFCQVCCEIETLGNHQHFSNQHRPTGLNRHRWSNNKHLVMDICTASVASNCKFRNSDTNEQWVKYEDYCTVNDYYKSWIIQKSPSAEAASYWKKVFHIFNQDFAKHYNAEPADITDAWNIPWDRVKDDLNKTYYVSLKFL